MGIKNLNKFLRDKFEDVFIPIHLSQYAYKKVAIDISLYIHKYKAICGDRWLSAFVKLISSLRRNEIHCVFIFDGEAPKEKTAEKAKRKEEKEKLVNYVCDLEDALDTYHKTNVIEPILLKLYSQRKESPKRLLGGKKDSKFDIIWVEEKISQKRQQIIDICPDDYNHVRKLFDILRVPYLTAIGEAEKMCAKLSIDNLVDAVLSEDTDVLAYGASNFISKIDTYQDTCMLINYDHMLALIDITQHQFLDLCIMCGTDYNDNIPKVGSHTAFKHLLVHKSIEEIGKNTSLDISILSHERGRELFTIFPDYKVVDIPYCGRPDFDLLKNFLSKHNINFDIKDLQRNFEANITIID